MQAVLIHPAEMALANPPRAQSPRTQRPAEHAAEPSAFDAILRERAKRASRPNGPQTSTNAAARAVADDHSGDDRAVRLLAKSRIISAAGRDADGKTIEVEMTAAPLTSEAESASTELASAQSGEASSATPALDPALQAAQTAESIIQVGHEGGSQSAEISAADDASVLLPATKAPEPPSIGLDTPEAERQRQGQPKTEPSPTPFAAHEQLPPVTQSAEVSSRPLDPFVEVEASPRIDDAPRAQTNVAGAQNVMTDGDTRSESGSEGASEGPARASDPRAGAVVAIDPSLSPAVRRALEVEMLMRTGPATAAPDRSSPLMEIAAGGSSQASLGGPMLGQTAAHESLVDRASPVDADAMLSRIVRGMHAMVHHRGGLLSMRLQPPELGQIRIQMIVHGQSVTARIEADTPEAHGLLKSNLASLQRGLEQHGLVIERLSVHLTPSAPAGEAHSGQAGHQDGDEGLTEQHDSQREQGTHRDENEERDRGRSDQEQHGYTQRTKGTAGQARSPNVN